MDTSAETAAVSTTAREPVESKAGSITADDDKAVEEDPTDASQQQQQQPIIEEPDDDAPAGRPDGHFDGEESGGEHVETSDTSEAEDRLSEEPPQNFTIKVQQVAAEVDEISKGVEALSQNVRSLDTDRLPSDPHRAAELLRELRGRCQHFTDSLLRDMTVLDSLSLPEEHRPVRKAQVALLCS